MNNIQNLSPEEKRKLLAQLIREKKKAAVPEDIFCITQLFESQAAKTPENTAVEDTQSRLSYRELNARANKLAHYLQSLNIGVNARVGLYLHASPDRIIALLGILKAGGVYVPFAPEYPNSYLTPIIVNAKLSAIVTHSSFVDDLASVGCRVVCLDRERVHIDEQQEEYPKNGIAADDLAYISYDSGRAVPVDRAALFHRLKGFCDRFPFSESDRAGQTLSPMQDAAIVETLAPLLSGAVLVTESAQEAAKGAALSVIHFTPSGLKDFLDTLNGDAAQNVTSLKRVFCSGEFLPQSTVEVFFQHFDCELYHLYSLPEASGEVMFTRCRAGFEREVIPFAQTLNGKTVYVLDELMQPLPPGVKGEIYIGGRHLAQGYLSEAETDTQHFVVNPFAKTERERLFKSGEFGYWLHDGALELAGMLGRHARRQGRQVNLAEIEAAFSDSPLVTDCRVLARKTEEADLLLVAYLVLSGAASCAPVHAEMQSVLPNYMLPDAYVPVNILPLSEDGLIDERALAELAVCDSAKLKEWESEVQSMPEIDRATILVTQKTEKIPHRHLADLLPDWKRGSLHEERETATEEEIYYSPRETRSVPALSSGGERLDEPDAPDTLGKALQALQSCEHHIIYIQPDGSETPQSYAELLQEAERILKGLRKQGLKPQDKVILQLTRNEDILASFWGCILGGFIPVITAIPPSYKESNRPLEQFCHIWNLLEQPLVIFDAKLEGSIQALSQWIPVEAGGLALVDSLRDNVPDTDYHPAQPDDVAFFPMTSGSTGAPKCIILTHRNLLSRARGTNHLCGHSVDDVILNWLPFDHIGSISDWHVRCIDLGCQAIYAQKEYILARALNWLDLIDRYGITHSWAPNFAFSLVNNTLDSEPEKQWELSCLESLLSAGEAVSSDTVEVFKERLARFGFKKTAVRPAFGMAEMASGITYFQPTDELPGKYHRVDRKSLGGQLTYVGEEHPHSITFTDLGPPIPGISLRIISEQGEILPEETLGRFQVKGDPISKGYYHNPEATQEVYLADGWFDTGDIGFLSDGHLVITGRAKESIIVNGANYYCNEIESVVEAVEGVEVSYSAACAVHEFDSATEKLALFFNTEISEDAPLLELLKHIQSQMTRHLGLKADYLLPVSKEMIPKTAIGKIQRLQLGKRFETGDFDELLQKLDLLWENANTLPDWFFQKIWRHKEAESSFSRPDESITLIFMDELGLGDFLNRQLREQGQFCIMIKAGEDFKACDDDSYQIAPANLEHYTRLLESISERKIGRILHLWSYTEYAEISNFDELECAQKAGLFSLLHLVQALAKNRDFAIDNRQSTIQNPRLSLYLLVSYAQALTSSDTLAYEKTTLPGFIKTVELEIPWLRCCLLDLPAASPEVYGEQILREIDRLPTDREIVLRDGQRLISRLGPVSFDRQKAYDFPIKTDEVYLISGGLGGIGLEISKCLLEHYRVKLLLLGIAAKEEKAVEIAMLEQHGDILYQTADVCDPAQVRQAVEEAHSRWDKKLDGVIQLAGVLQERGLLEESAESVAATLRPKVQGSFVLHRQLLEENPEGVFIMFSSVNGFFGGSTVATYSAANSFLDSFCAYQNANTSLKSYCLTWSMWDDIGISRNYLMKDFSREQGYYAIKPAQGISSLMAVLQRKPGQIFIGLDAAKTHIQRYVQSKTASRERLNVCFTPVSLQSETVRLQEFVFKDRFHTRCPFSVIQLDDMPLTESGEIDRRQLLALVGVSGRSMEEKPAAARNELEQFQVELWQEILELDEIGIHDDFFELGGNSIKGAMLINRLQEKLQQSVSITALFESPSIAELSEHFGETASYSSIEKVPDAEHYPVSHAQRRLWILDRIDGGSAAYNMPGGVVLEGELDRQAVEKAIHALIQDHESLRTSFIAVEGEPRQRILDFGLQILDLDIVTYMDLSAESDPEARARDLAREDAVKPFDLTQAPLLRVKLLLLKTPNTKHILLFNMHHIIADGWSMGVVIREFCRLYEYFRLQIETPQSQIFNLQSQIQYRDYAQWQNRLLESEAVEAHRSYWHTKLGGELPVLNLPADFSRPPMQTFNGSEHSFKISVQQMDRLHNFNHKHGVSMFMTLLGLVKVLLYRYTGQEDIITGSPVAGRSQQELEEQIGLYVNTLALRDTLHGETSFEAFLRDVKQSCTEAYQHQIYPFDKLVDELDLQRDISRNPLFDVMVVHNDLEAELELEGLTIKPFEIESQTSKLDLTFHFTTESDGLHVDIEYNSDLCLQERIERLGAHLRELLESVLANSEQPVSRLNLLPDSERQQLVYAFNDTAAAYPREKTIMDLFEEQVAKTPNNPAVIAAGRRLSYRELNECANQVANFLLAEYQLQPDDRVGVLLERSEWMIVGIFGILKAGAAYVPIEPRYPASRIEYMLTDSQCKLVLIEAQYEDRILNMEIAAVNVSTIRAESKIANRQSSIDDPLAYVIYTSGSTGRPKGTMIEHHSVLNRILWMQNRYPLAETDMILQKTPFTFDVSVWELFWWSFCGAALYMLKPGGEKDPAEIVKAIEGSQITTIHFVPSMFNSFLTVVKEQQWAGRLASLKHVFTSGEALTANQVQLFNSLIFETQGTQLHNLYGPTEATVDVSYFDCSPFSGGDVVPIGKPIENMRLYILDRHNQPLPPGVPGEICISGVGVGRGYLNKPELTQTKFTHDPFYPDARMYRSGDIGRWLSDGNIEYLGRNDDQVKIRGNRIELGEIEHRLLEHHSVRNGVVVTKNLNGQKELAAYLVSQDEELNVTALREHLKASLPDYMIPSHFVRLEDFPLTPSGKVDKKALPNPVGVTMKLGSAYEAPRNEDETVLADIWQEVLGKERIGIHDNYFALGGDSIKAIQIIARLLSAGFTLELRDIFQYPTIAELAFRMKAVKTDIEIEEAGGESPLTAIQHWFFQEFEIDRHHFNQAILLQGRPRFDEERLRSAMNALIRQHDAFRLKYRIKEDSVIQYYAEQPPAVPFELIDLQRQAEALAGMEAHADEVQASLNLEQEPLMKVVLYRFDECDRLFIVIHHLIVDGVSWRILLEDLHIAYQQLDIALPSRSSSFQAWSRKIQEYGQSSGLKREQAYWLDTTTAPVTPLPFDLPDGENLQCHVRHVSTELPADLSALLLEDAHQAYNTHIEDLLLTAFMLAFQAWTGESRVRILLEGHGRESVVQDVDVSRTVGWFTSMYPVLLTLPGEGELGEHIIAIKEILRQVPNKGVGYGVLRYIKGNYTLSNATWPDITFNYLGQFDRDVKTESFSIDEASSGNAFSPRQQRLNALDITGMVLNGRLSIDIIYSAKQFHEASLRKLLDEYVAALQTLIQHCQAPEAGAYSVSDFPDIDIDTGQLDGLLSEIEQSNE